ncbi:MAG: Holliday junction branch migration protein RuvA [Gemmataceae bacterium]
MITRITGTLNRALDEEVRLQVGAFEYQVLVPEFIRRVVQNKLGQELALHTMHYFDGDPSRGKVVPRLVGFTSEADLEFFELFCTVDGVGTKKALKAMVRPIKEVADAIQRQDSKWLTTLPGIGASTAEKVIATLKRKVTRWALAPSPKAQVNGAAAHEEIPATPTATVEGSMLEEAYQALMALGHNPVEARERLDKVIMTGKTFTSTEEVLRYIYNTK